MTQEKIDKLVALFFEFKKECERVGKILHNINCGITSEYRYANTCYNWGFSKDCQVVGRGIDYDGEEFYFEFPPKYLTMSDQELKDMVNKMNAKYEEKIKKENEFEAKRIEEEELAELKRLQEKYKDKI